MDRRLPQLNRRYEKKQVRLHCAYFSCTRSGSDTNASRRCRLRPGAVTMSPINAQRLDVRASEPHGLRCMAHENSMWLQNTKLTLFLLLI